MTRPLPGISGDAANTNKLPEVRSRPVWRTFLRSRLERSRLNHSGGLQDYLKVVQDTHQNGGTTGSIGYRMDWKEEEARKNLLRCAMTPSRDFCGRLCVVSRAFSARPNGLGAFNREAGLVLQDAHHVHLFEDAVPGGTGAQGDRHIQAAALL